MSPPPGYEHNQLSTGSGPGGNRSTFSPGARPAPGPTPPAGAMEPEPLQGQTRQQMIDQFVEIFQENRRAEIDAIRKLVEEHQKNPKGSKLEEVKKQLKDRRDSAISKLITRIEKGENPSVPDRNTILKVYNESLKTASEQSLKKLLSEFSNKSSSTRATLEKNPENLPKLLDHKTNFDDGLEESVKQTVPAADPKQSSSPAPATPSQTVQPQPRQPSPTAQPPKDPKQPSAAPPSAIIDLGEGFKIAEPDLLKVYRALVGEGLWEQSWGPPNMAIPGELPHRQVLKINELRVIKGLSRIEGTSIKYSDLFKGLVAALDSSDEKNVGPDVAENPKREKKENPSRTNPRASTQSPPATASASPTTNSPSAAARPTPTTPPPIVAANELSQRISNSSLHNKTLPPINGKDLFNIKPQDRERFARAVMANSLGKTVSEKTGAAPNSNVWQAFWRVVDAIKAQDPNHQRIPADQLPMILGMMLTESAIGTIGNGNIAQVETPTWNAFKDRAGLGDVNNTRDPFKAALFIKAYCDDVIAQIDRTGRPYSQLTDPEKLAALANAYNVGTPGFIKAYSASGYKTSLMKPGPELMQFANQLSSYNRAKIREVENHAIELISYTWAIRGALARF